MANQVETKWCLSWQDFENRRQMLRKAAREGDRNRVRFLLKWWREFEENLSGMIEAEMKNYQDYPDEYFMPLEEVAYFWHWKAQLEEVRVVLYGINGLMRVWYEQE